MSTARARILLVVTFSRLLRNGFAGLGFDLARGLVFGQVELFLNLALAEAQVLVVLLLLECCADFGFQLFRPFTRLQSHQCSFCVGATPAGEMKSL